MDSSAVLQSRFFISFPYQVYFFSFRALRNGYKIGSRCRLRCRKGYKPVSGQRKLCQTNATWTGSHGTCEAVTCPHPSAPVNGHVDCSRSGDVHSNVGDSCEVTCDDGFTLEGGHKATCSLTGQWQYEGAPPSCKGAQYPPPFILCPPDIVKPLPPGSSSVYVMFSQPKTNVDWFR